MVINHFKVRKHERKGGGARAFVKHGSEGFVVVGVIRVVAPPCCFSCTGPAWAHLPPHTLATLLQMRSNIISYNLSGMGCSCSPIAIDLARQMLQLYPSTYALVLSTENITQNW